MASSAASGDVGPPVEAEPRAAVAPSPQGSVTSVKVAVRVRPLVGMETAQGCVECMFGDNDNNQVIINGDSRRRKFDNVFGADSTQEQVYQSTALPLVRRCLEGFNATILAYGQTGSGKTHTVGNAYTVNGSPEDAGIIPRAVTDLFKRIEELRAEGVKASVHASFLEVINEEIKDLIGGGDGGTEGAVPAGLPLRENAQGEVTVSGLSKHEINGAENLQTLLERGALCRTTASTNMNAHSSRSHAICTLSFQMVRPATETSDETVTSSLFHLVDLAGSERAKKTGAEGKRLREGININKGLLALGNVISALAEGCGSGGGGGGGHVPYRDSKLTRLLQGSLGGNSHTLMIACISPADSNMGESVNTLRYAERAMNIQNTAVKNEDVSGPPVSYAEVMALRKQVRVMEVELVQARLSGLAGGFGFGTGGRGMGMGGEGGGGEAYRDALEEATELRRGQADLERRALEETRRATQAVEGEMSARLESDTWRLRCEQLSALLKEKAPRALDDLPAWATGEQEEQGEGSSEPSGDRLPESGGDAESSSPSAVKEASGPGAAGSLARELRKKVFDLEQTVFSLEGRLRLADEARLERRRGGGGSGGGDCGLGAVVAVPSVGAGVTPRVSTCSSSARGLSTGSPTEECSFDSFDSEEAGGGGGGVSFEGSEGGGPEDGEPGGDGGVEEIRRVDEEIESKERELQMKARQAQAYEAMKGQFEGLLGRLQGEVTSLQSERDGLLHKLSRGASSSSSASRPGGGGGGGGGSGGGGGAALAKMKARVAELEARIKENRKKVAEHQRAERERAAAAKEAERLRAEVAEAKQRRAELQRTHREASTRFMKETRQLHLKDARMRRDGERMQWQVKKLQESQERTQAALKRKMEEHSMAMKKVRTLQSHRTGGRGGIGDGAGSGAGGRGDARHPSVKEAKKAEMEAWLATEIEEDTAVQRAKRALKAQLILRGEAAGRAQELREDAARDEGGVAGGAGAQTESEGGQQGELEALEGRIATASKAIKSLQTFLVSTDRKNTGSASRLAAGVSTTAGAGGAAGTARWARIRTAWDSKTALSLLFSEAVKFKVLGMDFAESSALKDMEVRRLLRENCSLRSTAAAAAATAADGSSGGGGRAAAVAAAVAAAEAQVSAAVGGGGDDSKAAEQKQQQEEEEEEEEEEEGDGGEYEVGEQSFVVVSDDTDDDDDDSNSEFDPVSDEDEDEEWLPDSLLAHKKRSSSSSSTAPGATAAASAAEAGGTKGSFAGADAGSAVKDERLSCGSAASSSSRVSVLSVYSEDGEGTDGWSGIDWDHLNFYTNPQLKDFLRRHNLPVSGKKEVLINRLVQAARDSGHLPQVPPSSPAGSDFSFSLPGLDDPAADAAAHRGPERDNEGAAGALERSGGEDGTGESAKEDAAGGYRYGRKSRPAVAAAAAAAAGKPKTTLKERLEARVRDRDLAAKRQAAETPPPSGAPGGGPNGAVASASSGNGSNSSGSSSRKRQGRPTIPSGDAGRDRPSAATQGKHRPASSQPRTSNEAGTAAAATSAMGPPRVRKALGSLGSGNVSGAGAGRPTDRPAGIKAAVVKQKSPTIATQVGETKSQQPVGGGSASAQQKRGHGGTSGPSARGVVKTARTSGVAGSSDDRSASRAGTIDRVSSSCDAGKGKEGRNASSGIGKRPVQAGAVTAAGSAASHKRAKVDGGGSGGGGGGGGLRAASTKASALPSKHAKPSSSGGVAPSFMKPTKTSGARNVGLEE